MLFSVLGPQHVETRRIVVLMHDLELELRRQQQEPAVVVNVGAVDSGGESFGKKFSKVGARASKKASPIKSGVASPKKKLDREARAAVRPQPQDPQSHALQKKSMPPRQKAVVAHTSGIDQNQHQSGPKSSNVPLHHVLQHQQRPVSPTFQPLPVQTPARVHTPTKNSPTASSPCSKVSVSPTFVICDADTPSLARDAHARRSANNESSVSPTFNNSREFDPASPQDSVVMLSNVKRHVATPNLVGGGEAFEREVFDIDFPFEHSAVPTAPAVARSQHARAAEASSIAATELQSAPAASRLTPSFSQKADLVADYSNYHRIYTHRLQYESLAQMSLAVASNQSLAELNDRTILNLKRNQLVERAPDLTQIFVPVTSALAYVLCDLNAGPDGLGKRFSDSINQLRREDEALISPRKAGQGKCLKVILLEPSHMQVARLFSCNSLRDSECFRYMNTESTVETITFRGLLLPSALEHGDNIDMHTLPSRLSMNDFLHLAGIVSAWNCQSQDHVCCILMDVLHGARMSSLLLGMLSVFIGQCSDAANAKSWLDANGAKSYSNF